MDKLRLVLKIISVFVLGVILYSYGKSAFTGGDEYVPEITAEITAPDRGNPEKKSINSATEYDIKKVKGFGKRYAKRIIEYRNQIGGFKGMEDLINVYQIGGKRYEMLRERFSI